MPEAAEGGSAGGLLADETRGGDGGIAAWQTACVAGACAAAAVAAVCLAARRYRLWRKREQDSSRYRPASPLRPVRAAWTGDSGSETPLPLHSPGCEADMVKALAPGDDDQFELEPRGQARGASCWAAFGRAGEGKRPDAFVCPQPSPGSRQAFAQRWSGPRKPCAGGFDRLSSPGFVPDHASPHRSSPHYGCRNARYLGDSERGCDGADNFSPTRHGQSFSFASAVPDQLSPLRCSPDASPTRPILAPLAPGGLCGASNDELVSARIPVFWRARADTSDSARRDPASASDPGARSSCAAHEQAQTGEPPSSQCPTSEHGALEVGSGGWLGGFAGRENSVARQSGARKSLTFASTSEP